MRTTLEFPDALFRQAKRAAMDRGCTLKELVTQAVAHELKTPVGAASRKRHPLPTLRLPANAPILRLSAAKLADLDAEEELGRLL